MIRLLSPTEIVLWACIGCVQILLSFLLVRTETSRKYPAFCFYVYFVTITSVLLIYLALAFSEVVYFYAYYFTSFVTLLLMALVVMEIYARAYGPAQALPARTVRRIRILLFSVCLAVLLVGAMVPIARRTTTIIVNISTAIERMMIAALLIAPSLLFFYSGKLGLSWRSRIAGVAIGFVLFLSFNVLSAFFRGNAPPRLVHLAGSCGQLSYLFVFVYWCWRFRNIEPVVQWSTEQTQLIKDELMKVRPEGQCGIRT
jgi:hypothetical protein